MSVNRDAAYRDELAKLTPGLRRFARALVDTHNADAADDLVQCALVAALAETQERRGLRLNLWLLGTMVSQHRRSSSAVAADRHATAGTGGGQGTAGQWQPARRPSPRTADLLSDLPLQCREVFLLVALEELSYVQTAECLGMTLNGVIANLAKAREHLSRMAQRPGAQPAVQRPAATSRPVPYLRVVK